MPAPAQDTRGEPAHEFFIVHDEDLGHAFGVVLLSRDGEGVLGE
jgi:hypothetical protein